MTRNDTLEEAIEILQQLGLKEYEARCFVGLSRLPTATAKRLSEITDVPRTRVYDAIRVLEAQGLVEIQYSSPQRYRAVPIEEATETLRDQYETRFSRLSAALDGTDQIDTDDDESAHEVWSLSGGGAIANRTRTLVGEADAEVVLVLGVASLATDDLFDELRDLDDVDLLVGTADESLQARVRDAVPGARTFVSGIDWLGGADETGSPVVGAVLLVDRETLLVSSIEPETGEQNAIFGRGFRNGLVIIARRLLSQGLVPAQRSGQNA